MNHRKYVFFQLVEYMDENKFYHIVKKYNADRGNRGFSCWNQLLMMFLGQLSNRESLRDLITVLEAHRSKSIIWDWAG
jgi:hypothetical protein